MSITIAQQTKGILADKGEEMLEALKKTNFSAVLTIYNEVTGNTKPYALYHGNYGTLPPFLTSEHKINFWWLCNAYDRITTCDISDFKMMKNKYGGEWKIYTEY